MGRYIMIEIFEVLSSTAWSHLVIAQILSDPLGSSRVLSGPLVSSRIHSGPFGSSRVLSGPLGFLSGPHWSPRVPSGHFVVLSGPFGSSLESSRVLSSPLTCIRMLTAKLYKVKQIGFKNLKFC
jgi:hypothetical protein